MTDGPSNVLQKTSTRARKGLIFLVLVACVHPHKVRITGVSARPEKTRGAIGRIGCRLDGGFFSPGVGFPMAVGKRNRAVVAVEDCEGVHPA